MPTRPSLSLWWLRYSGIEDNIKMWLPIREEPNTLDDCDNIISENKRQVGYWELPYSEIAVRLIYNCGE
jgi:hypothetical protein